MLRKPRPKDPDRKSAEIKELYAKEIGTMGPRELDRQQAEAQRREAQRKREAKREQAELKRTLAQLKREQTQATRERRARQSKRAPQPDWTRHPELIEQVVDHYIARRERRGHRLPGYMIPEMPIKNIVFQYHQRTRGLSKVARSVRMKRETVKQILRRLNQVAAALGLT